MEFQDEIMALVVDGVGDVGKLLLEHEDQKDRIVEMIKTVCSERTSTESAGFITTKLIPALLTLSNEKVRPVLLELCWELTRKHPINFLNRAQICKFKTVLCTSYIANLEAIRKSGDERWSHIWQLLVRYLQEHLHTDVTFANTLFRIVEAAFRVNTHRNGGYDCWIELIKNYQSSSEALLKAPRHIKLLVTPLKVKLSLVDAVAFKRFEVWTFLLKVLKESAIEILEGFFNLYFYVKNSPLSVCKGATEILLEILGHKKFCRESNCWTGDQHGFNALIKPQNYEQHYEFIIKSVVQCCTVLDRWSTEDEQKQIATCLWTTLTALGKNLESSVAFKVKKQILDVLEDTIMAAYRDNKPLNMATIAVLELDVKQYAFGVFKKIFISQREYYKEALSMLLEQCKRQMDTKKVFKLSFFIFSEKDLKCDEDFFLMIWTVYQNFYYTSSHTNFSPKEVANFLSSYVPIFAKNNEENSFGVKTERPQHPMQLQSDKNWCELFNKLRVFQLDAISELSNYVKTASNVYSFVSRFFELLIKACSEDVEKQEYCVIQLYYDVMLSILYSNKSSFTDLANIANMTKVLLKANLRRFSEQQQAQLVQQNGMLIKKLIFAHKIYQLFSDIETFTKSVPICLIPTLEAILYNPMFELITSQQADLAQSATTICNALKAKPPFQHPSIDLSRGAKLTKMLRNSWTTMKATSKKSPSTSEFPAIFGKPNEEYVPIDTEVKFDKSKLNAHQKQQIKKRKDDIPSMYADLTQSTQSQSLSEDTTTGDSEENGKKLRKRKSVVNGANVTQNTKKNSPKQVIRQDNKTTKKNGPKPTVVQEAEDFSAILGKEIPHVVIEHVDSTKNSPEDNLKNGFAQDIVKQMDEIDVHIDQELANFAVSVVAESTTDQVQRRKRGRPRSSCSKPKTTNDLPENQKRKRGRSNNKPKSTQTETPTTRVTRRSATPVPSLLTDPAYASSPGVQRELARLRIDACLGKILPGLDDISLNLPRVTRRLRKREQKTPETITSPENNNTQVVESSQDTIVHIKPLGESETQSKPKEKVDETENCNSSEKINVDLDRPVVPELTPTLLEGAEKETESIEPDDSLPGSPITVETPTRTSELRSNTSQISPIRSKTTPLVQKTLEEYMETPRTTPKTVLNCGNRSKKLVDLANNQQQVEEERIVATPVGKQESDKEAFLTFSRELPSSSAVPPGGSILKRKNPDFTDDSSSPCVKRKRVNFPDPPTTSEKLIPIEEKTAKKCKKQLIMTTNDLEAVIAPEIETDSSSVDVKPCIEELMREAETQTVPPEESTTANDYFVEAKNSWMKAIKAIDQNNENDVSVLKETLRDIGNTVPPVIWGEYLKNIIGEWSRLPRNTV